MRKREKDNAQDDTLVIHLPLTDDEKLEYSNSLVKLLAKKIELEGDFAIERKDHNEKMNRLNNDINKIVDTLERGIKRCPMRSVDLRVENDHENLIVKYYDKLTDNLVWQRRMTEDEIHSLDL